MNVLITGASFNNKGAQAMLYTVVNEFRNHDTNTEFYYLPVDYYKPGCFDHCEDFRFHFVIDDKSGRDFPAKFGPLNYAVRWANTQKILRNAQQHGEVLALSRLWDKLDVLVDVSGYSLTSKFGISSVNRVLRMIRTAKAHGVKTILLPQSYGPFDSDWPSQSYFAESKNLLSSGQGLPPCSPSRRVVGTHALDPLVTWPPAQREAPDHPY